MCSREDDFLQRQLLLRNTSVSSKDLQTKLMAKVLHTGLNERLVSQQNFPDLRIGQAYAYPPTIKAIVYCSKSMPYTYLLEIPVYDEVYIKLLIIMYAQNKVSTKIKFPNPKDQSHSFEFFVCQTSTVYQCLGWSLNGSSCPCLDLSPKQHYNNELISKFNIYI